MPDTHLYAPWRIDYLRGLTDAAGDEADRATFLADAADPAHDADAMRQRLVLLRDGRGVLMLNRYPYTNAHLLAAPLRAVPQLSDLSPDERAGLMELTDLAVRLLQRAVNCQGANIGMNIGRCAGAGVPGHLHMHIVPRWNGDVNFATTVAGVRVIPQALTESYDVLKRELDAMLNSV